MSKRIIILLVAAIVSLSFINITVFADGPTDGSSISITGEQDQENKGPKDKEAKWLENKARIAEKKAALAARKEAFFALKEQTKQKSDEIKALIKEQKALIKEQIQLINELSPHERKKLKADIKLLWEEVRETQRYLWQIRQTAVDQAHDILGNVEIVKSDLNDDRLQEIEALVNQL